MLDIEELPNHLKTLPPEKWDELFGFIPLLEKNKESFGEMIFERKSENEHYLPYMSYSELVYKVQSKLYDLKLIPVFDWNNWKEWETIKRSDVILVEDTFKLFTVMVRADRFCEGFMKSWFEDGTVLKLLIVLKNKYGKL